MDDLISRQAAIDVEGIDEQIRCEMCENPMHTDRGCDGNCKYDEKLYKRIMQILGERIKPLPSVQPEPKWIPCDKGEPDEDTECWVTVKTTDALYRGNFTKRYGERRNKGFITSDGFMWWNTALAWMPIYEPEPYRPEGDDKHEG